MLPQHVGEFLLCERLNRRVKEVLFGIHMIPNQRLNAFDTLPNVIHPFGRQVFQREEKNIQLIFHFAVLRSKQIRGELVHIEFHSTSISAPCCLLGGLALAQFTLLIIYIVMRYNNICS